MSDIVEGFTAAIKQGKSKLERERGMADFAIFISTYYNALINAGLSAALSERLVTQFQAQLLAKSVGNKQDNGSDELPQKP